MAIKLYSKQEYEKLMQQIPQAKSRTESVAQGTSSFAPIKLYAKEEFSVGQKSRKQENTARKAYETDYAKLSAMTRLAERQQENELPALEAQAGKAKEDAKRFRGRMNWLTEAQTAEHAKATRTAREASDAAEALRQELQREAWAQQAAKSRQHATDLMINVPSDARPDVGKAAQNTAGFGDFGRYMNYVISPEIKAFVDKAMPEALKRGRDYPALNSMTEFEKKALLYYAEQSEDKAREYFEAMLPEWRAGAAKRDAEQETYKARENKAYGVYRNLTEAPAQMDALLESISQYAKNQTTGRNDPIDPNAPRMKGVWRTQATREGITDGMNEGAKFLTDTALSLGQYAMKLPMGQFALLALGVEAAGSKAYDVTKRGGSAGEALLAGGMAGAIEALTEKMPLDMLFKISKAGARTAKEAIWNTLKQAGVEAGEEMVSELANNVVDLRVMGDRSEMERTVRDLMENEGMTRAQAENRAFEQFFVWNTLLAGAGGALSGGVMAGAGNVVGNYQNAVELQDGRFETMMREIQESDPRQKLFPKEPQQSKTDEAFARLDEWLESRARKQETPSGGKLPQFLLDSMEAENKKAAKTAVTRSFPTQEQGSIVRQLRNALPELSKMQPVSSVTGNEIKRAGVKFIDAAMQFVENIGGKVNRPGFGDVLFSKAKVKGSFIGHGVGDAKIETFAAVPDVIARGEQVAHEKNWKGKGYDTYLFAAPIEYRGKRGILGAIVAKDKESNRYYLHEVIDQNGDIIYNMGETAEGPSDRRSGLAADLDTVAPSAVSKNNVPQEIPFVKNEPKQNNYQFPTATTNKEKGGKLPQFLLDSMEQAREKTGGDPRLALMTKATQQAPNAVSPFGQTSKNALAHVAETNAPQEIPFVKAAQTERQASGVATAQRGAQRAKELREAYPRIKQAERDLAKIKRTYDLTKAENDVAREIVRGLRTFERLDNLDAADVEGITETALAMQEVEDARKVIAQFNEERKQLLQDKARELTENAFKWKDKGMGFLYQRETLKRNFRDITGSDAEAQALVDYYWTPARQNEANNNRMKNGIAQEIGKLRIGRDKKYRVSYVDDATNNVVNEKVSESALVQLLGEKKIKPQQIKEAGADLQKIEKAVTTFRKAYDALFEKANDVLVLNGYAPIEKLPDYFPHFEDGKPDTLLQKAAAALGMKIDQNALPTDIAGMTHTFRPGKQWVGNFLHREGKATAYDALQGMDRYLNGVGNVIWHTEDIQKLRMLENELRYMFSDDGVQEEVDTIRSRDDLAEWQKESNIATLYEDRAKLNGLGNFVTDLRSYTDSLAGKKQLSDRQTEYSAGRWFYDFVKKVEGRIAANMVALNPGSWLTNFIPLVQGGAQLKSKSVLQGARDMVKAAAQDDGFREHSTFLTNRAGADMLDMTNTQKVVETLAKPMYWIDMFTAETLVRARYAENLQNGMSEQAAMQEADEWAGDVMVDRSKGALPTWFEKKSPLVKAVSMFQVEVNNQYSYLFKDIPREQKEKGLAYMLWVFFKLFMGSYLYNALYSQITGRDAAFDPIGMAEDTAKRFANPKMKTSAKISETIADIGREVPFLSGLIGGGRIPIAAAAPDSAKLLTVFDDDVSKERKQQVAGEEVLGTLGAYLALPAGGGQIRKTMQGVKDFVQGGNYAVNKDGEEFMKFPVAQTPANAVRGALFGRYAIPEAKDYVDSGFKAYTPKQTKIIKQASAEGMTQKEAIATLNAVLDAQQKAGKRSNEIVRGAIAKTELTEEQKELFDKLYLNDSYEKRGTVPDYSSFDMAQATAIVDDKQRAKATEAVRAGFKYADYERHMKKLGDMTSDKEFVGGKSVPGSKKKKQLNYIKNHGFSWKEKVALAHALGYDESDVWAPVDDIPVAKGR